MLWTLTLNLSHRRRHRLFKNQGLRVAVGEFERQREGARDDALASVQRGDKHGVYVLGRRFGLNERRELYAPFSFDK